MKQNNRRFIFEDDDEVFGTTDAMPLSQVPSDAAKAAMTKGDKKIDAVPSDMATVPASSLKAAQTEIIPEKALAFAVMMINHEGPFKSGPGGPLGSIISKDNFIMDGHHRWAATYLVDPGATITAKQIDLPGKALVTALNVVTKAADKSGNKGKGDITNFTAATFDKVVDTFLKDGWTDEKGNKTTLEKTKQALETLGGGDVKKGKEIIMKNADALPKTIMPGAPARVEMPVIEPDEVDKVAKSIAAGEIDIKPPYSPDVKAKIGKTESIMRQMENYYLTRIGKKPLRESTLRRLREYNKKNQKRLYESYAKNQKKKKLQEKLNSLLSPLVEQTIRNIIKNAKKR